MKKIKKFLVIFAILTVALITTSCTNKSPNSNDSAGFETTDTSTKQDLPLLLTSTQVSQESRMTQMKADLLIKNNGYTDDDEVIAIVELSNDSLVQVYNESYSLRYSSLSEFATSPIGESIARDIATEQTKFLSELSNKGYTVKVEQRYSSVLNAVAVTTSYKNFKELSKFDSATSVVMSETYNVPQTTTVSESNTVTNVVDVYDTGIFNSSNVPFNGSNTAVAILDSGFDVTHEVFQNQPSEQLITEQDVAKVLNSTNAIQTTPELLVSNVHYTNKIPFAYDYADEDYNVAPTTSNHGTHVAGIIAGKSDVITGVAVESQLVLMKVFGDVSSGAPTEVLLAALEDSVLLGVDAINMSLGTSCGFSREEDGNVINAVYDSINEAGISLIVAASNSYGSGYGASNGNNTNKVTNPDSATVGSPSTYSSALSVASISGTKSRYIIANGSQSFYFLESNDITGKQNNFIESLADSIGLEDSVSKTLEYVTVPGNGLSVNYANIDVRGKIALVRRGNNTFEEKAQIAYNRGAIACIIYNNVAGEIYMSMGKNTKIPTISISQDDGLVLASKSSGTMTINTDYQAGPFISNFSSWGPTPDLKLKPEITAHGGNITSAVQGGGYDELSGTSMACPNMAGVVVLIRQYLKEKYPNYTNKQISDLAYQILMSTATITLNEDGLAYSPRKQGAGLANLSDAITTDAYLTVDGSDRTKLELGDDPNRTGVYTMKFNVVNLSSSAKTYDLSVIALTESVSTADPEYVAEKSQQLSGITAVSAGENATVEGQTISVNPNSTAEIEVTYTLNNASKELIDSLFAYGMYVEGYVVLTPNEGKIDLNIPFLAFYGDWTEAPLFDKTFFEVESEAHDTAIEDEDKLQADYYATVPYGSYFGSFIIPLGSYVYTIDETKYDPIPAIEDHIAISDSMDNIHGINSVYAGLLRNAALVQFSITDLVTGEIIWTHEDANAGKAYSNGASTIPYYEALEVTAAELGLINNRQYQFNMTAYLDYGDGGADTNARNSFGFKFYMDNQAPTIKSTTYETEYDKTLKKNRYYVNIEVYDNHYAHSITPIMFDSESSYTALTDYPIPVYGEYGVGGTVRLEITDYLDLLSTNAFETTTGELITNSLGFIVEDYALNSNIYLCQLPGSNTESMTGLKFTQSVLNTKEGEVIDLTQYLESDDPITSDPVYFKYLKWTSSNENVAIVHEGEAVIVGTGSARITVTNVLTNVETNILLRVSSSRSTTSVIDESERIQTSYAVPLASSAGDTASLTNLDFTYFDTLYAHSSAGSATPIGETGDRIYISAIPSGLSMYPGERIQLHYNIKPWYLSEDRYELHWESTNSRYATVDENGVVSALAKGQCTIRLNIYVDGRLSNINASITLTVNSEFVLSNRTLVSYKGLGGDVVIPDDEGITTISSYAFSLYTYDYNVTVTPDDPYMNRIPGSNNTITSVTIPEGVATIEQYAFANLTALKKVTLPSSINYINPYAFAECGELEEINLNYALAIEHHAFYNCKKLNKVSLATADSPRIYSIGASAFENCSEINNLDLSKLGNAGTAAFKGCTALTDLVTSKTTNLSKNMFENSGLTSIELKVDRVPEGCFANCTNLESVTFKNNIVFIADSAFNSCSKLTDVVFEGSVKDIFSNAFANNTSLVRFVLPNSTVALADNVFKNSDNLDEVVFMPNTEITELGYSIFEGTSIRTFNTEQSSKYIFENNVLLNTDRNIIYFAVSGISTYTLDNSIHEVKPGAFSGLSSLTSLVISNEEIILGSGAFKNCTNLEHVTLPSLAGLTISEEAFENCSSLTSIDNLEYVKNISAKAFKGTKLSEISLSDNAIISEEAFMNNSYLISVVLLGNAVIGKSAFEDSRMLNTFTIEGENSTISIGNRAFYGNTSLSNIPLDKATSVGDYAFYNCTMLSTVNLLKATSVGDYAFANCSSVTTLTIPIIQSIGDYAFARSANNASGLKFTSLTLPETLISVGDYAFSGASSLTSIRIPSSLTEISEALFYNCSSLSEVVLPDTIKVINDFAFRSCSALTSINTQNVEEIGNYAFQSCTNLTQSNLSSAITIGDGAFSNTKLSIYDNVNSLQSVGAEAFYATRITTFDAPNLATIGLGAFGNCTLLTKFVLSDDLESISTNVFLGATRLENLAFGSEEQTDGTINSYAFLMDGVLYTILQSGKIQLTVVPAGKNIETLEIFESTYRVDMYAGNANTNIKKIILPDSLSVIGAYAFYGYTALETVEFRSFAAPTLESFTVEGASLETTDPGYPLLSPFISLMDGKEFYYFNFVNMVGKNNPLNLILPSNSDVRGYDSIVYQAYFGQVSDATRSDHVAQDDQTTRFLAAINNLPNLEDITLGDESLVNEAIAANNALKQDLTVFGYTQAQVDIMKDSILKADLKIKSLKRDLARKEVRDVQALLDSLNTTFSLSELSNYQSIYTAINKLTRDEIQILDSRNYDAISNAYYSYISGLNSEVVAVTQAANNSFAYSIVVQVLAMSFALGLAAIAIKKSLI